MPSPSTARRFLAVICLTPAFGFCAPAEATLAAIAPAINSIGLDLYRVQAKSAAGANLLLSPYSISSALAMTYAGADGKTKAEMHKVLHFPADPTASNASFHALANQLADLVRLSARQAAAVRKDGGEVTALRLDVANRLFIQCDYTLCREFLADLRDYFAASPESLDFKASPQLARRSINDWVANVTHDKIVGLLPEGQPTADTRLAIVNALYMRAAWQDDFQTEATGPEAFHLADGKSTSVPTMLAQRTYGYAKHPGYTVVSLPYSGGSLQFVLIVPDKKDGLSTLEQKLSVADIKEFAHLKEHLVKLHLPKFKLAPDTLPLADVLQALGLKTAFDQPPGSANFDRMAPRRPDDQLSIGQVYHKTWLSLDEHGTEAAAATVVMLVTLGVTLHPPTAIEVCADRPFLFAIQHVDSGACLFLGRVTDPRAN